MRSICRPTQHDERVHVERIGNIGVAWHGAAGYRAALALVALILAIGTFLWGRFVIVPATRVLSMAPVNPDGSATPELEAALARAKTVTVLELLGFLAIFTCMILMRFGL